MTGKIKAVILFIQALMVCVFLLCKKITASKRLGKKGVRACRENNFAPSVNWMVA